MTTLTTALPALRQIKLLHSIRRAWAANWLLTLAGLAHLALIPLFLVAWAVDPSTILGQPAWVKPLKFALSGGIYAFTFLWLLGYVRGWPRFKQFAAGATGVALLVETSLIAMQVIRGTASHFNAATVFDATVFSIMGGFITLIALLNLGLAILLLGQRLPDPVFAWGLRLGVLISFAGMAVAFLMTAGPTPAQRQLLAAGEPVTAIGAHSVGVEDGGPGLPLVGWSTEGGDLRVPHFVGLHGMQMLPLVGWVLTRPAMRRRLPQAHRLVLVWTAGLNYLGLTLLLTWQALRGQPLTAPDGATWSAFALLAGTVLLTTLFTWWHGQQVPSGVAGSLPNNS
ncbi:MAG: hypothetical protein DCC55_04525 [Chloroflexi bacterium]|nr:MAG: hypothetical protein DCC55_04525 [Chloroflexota bacterium]